MVEPIMYMGIGFLVAGLLVIGVIPLVHARAVRLTVRRLEALTPISMAEIQAEKDQLRAEFAMAMSRLEMSVEQMKAKSASQLAEIAAMRAQSEVFHNEIATYEKEIASLKDRLGKKTAEATALSQQLTAERSRTDQLRDDAKGARAAEGSVRAEFAEARSRSETL